MNKEKVIPIMFTCDDKYIPFLAVTLNSMEENASKKYKYEIKVLHTNNINAENQKKILKNYSNDIFQIEFVDISSCVEIFANKLHTRDYYSKATYYRLFIPNLYKEYDKVLYLDSDLVVKGDISELYNTQLGENFVAAAPDDFVASTPILWDYVENHIPLGKGNHSKYFNAGVLLMNTKKLRKIDFEGKFIDLLSKVKFDVAQDQDYLNCICRGKVKYLSLAWDKQPFPMKNLREKDVKIFHYNLDLKPWQKDGILYEDYFWDYAKQTEFFDEIMARKAGFTPEMVEVAAKQTENLVNMIISQANDVVENARIKKIVDAIFIDKDSPLIKKVVVTSEFEEEFDLLDDIVNVTSDPEKQKR